MEYTRLGRSGLGVSRICFGTWQFGGDWGEIDRDEAVAAVRRGLDLGIGLSDDELAEIDRTMESAEQVAGPTPEG